MSNFVYIKAMGVCAVIDGVIMLLVGSRFACLQYRLCYVYARWEEARYYKKGGNKRE